MSKVTVKGQVTIPRHIREKLGLKPGDQVEFVEEKGAVHLQKRQDPESLRSAIEKYRGFLKHLAWRDPDQLVEEMRGR